MVDGRRSGRHILGQDEHSFSTPGRATGFATWRASTSPYLEVARARDAPP